MLIQINCAYQSCTCRNVTKCPRFPDNGSFPTMPHRVWWWFIPLKGSHAHLSFLRKEQEKQGKQSWEADKVYVSTFFINIFQPAPVTPFPWHTPLLRKWNPETEALCRIIVIIFLLRNLELFFVKKFFYPMLNSTRYFSGFNYIRISILISISSSLQVVWTHQYFCTPSYAKRLHKYVKFFQHTMNMSHPLHHHSFCFFFPYRRDC